MSSMDENEKLVRLLFYELYIARDVCFDEIFQRIIKPHKTIQLVQSA